MSKEGMEGKDTPSQAEAADAKSKVQKVRFLPNHPFPRAKILHNGTRTSALRSLTIGRDDSTQSNPVARIARRQRCHGCHEHTMAASQIFQKYSRAKE
ncbi:hypothetical protein GX50_01453 [[Emmonsia] crescens]|uniref:Uncharacterized protein n=1 Tax=[Emmonsia] crescens TaxID=73230 RepID=A0A2B7ZR07_9EURO|nr:hypothetical protein GX50_01453 [Emmonsia crescens]